MKLCAALLLLVLAGCSSGPVTFPGPPKDAPVWSLNADRWPGTNNLIRKPNWDDAHAAR